MSGRATDLSPSGVLAPDSALGRLASSRRGVLLMRPTAEAIVPAGCIATALVAICATAYLLRNVWVGDAAVYLPFAQHAAAGHLFQFNFGQFSSGATSPLWGVLLGIPYLLGLGLGGAKAFALIVVLVALLAVLLASARISGSTAAASVAGLFVVGTMAWYGLVLYESALVVGAVALSLLATARLIRTWREDGGAPRRSLFLLVVVWAALPLVRPDAVVVVLAEASALVLRSPIDRRRSILITAFGLGLAAVPAAMYYGYSLLDLGTFSTSASERSFALQETGAHWIGPLFLSGDAIRQLVASFWLVAVVPGIAGLGLLSRSRSTRWVAVAGGLICLGYVMLLTFITPGYYDTSRYLLPITPVLAIGTAASLQALPGRRARLTALCLGALIIGGVSLADLRDRTDWLRTLGLTRQEVFERTPVDRINALARPGDTLLAYEVQLRYYLRGDVSVLSEDGITDAKVRPYQDRQAMAAFLRRYRPRWWIADRDAVTRPYMRGSVLDRVTRAFLSQPRLRTLTQDGIRFDLVARRSSPLAPGFGGWQLLFRLSYGRRPNPG